MTDADAFRAQFPVLEKKSYLNAGTEGPLPRQAADAVRQRIAAEVEGGRCGVDYMTSVKELAAELRQQDHERKLRQLAGKRKVIEAQSAALHAEAETEEAEVKFAIAQETNQVKASRQNAEAMANLRGGSTRSKGKTKMKP
jgi:hypothetical protein